MSSTSQFGGASRTASALFGNTGVHGYLFAAVRNARSAYGANWVSGVFQTVLSVTGPGTLNFAALRVSDTLRLRIIRDGVTCYDQSGAFNGFQALVGLGALVASNDGQGQWLTADFDPLDFNSSLLVEASNTATESGVAVEFLTNHRVR